MSFGVAVRCPRCEGDELGGGRTCHLCGGVGAVTNRTATDYFSETQQ